jgi:hypothetical protein
MLISTPLSVPMQKPFYISICQQFFDFAVNLRHAFLCLLPFCSLFLVTSFRAIQHVLPTLLRYYSRDLEFSGFILHGHDGVFIEFSCITLLLRCGFLASCGIILNSSMLILSHRKLLG